MLLAPVNNASPPFCCPTHLLETPSYDNDNSREMSLVKSSCQQCSNCPGEVPSVRSTLSATVESYRTNEAASSEGETSEYEDDEDDETTIEDIHKTEESSEDYSSSAAFEEARTVAVNYETMQPERVSEHSTSPTLQIADSSHAPVNGAPVTSPIKSPLPSLLRKHYERAPGVSRRRVRGLWGSHEKDLFAQLHEDILHTTLSYLSLADICSVSMVSKRWNYLANKESTFQTVDATDFVQRAYSNFSTKSPPAKAARETAQALSNILENHTPRSLTIRNIESKLCPDTYLPPLRGLQHLTLDRFTNLTDTHIHVWMLSSSSGQGRARDIHLRQLELENCPKLSNTAVKTIARHCPSLQGLSLAGNTRVDDLSELSMLWRVEGQNQSMHRSSSNLAFASTSSLLSLDAPPLTGPSAFNQKAPPRLQPQWNGDTSWKIDSPKLTHTSPKHLLSQGTMSSLFAPPDASKSGSFFDPPKKPRPSSPEKGNPEDNMSSLFLPPPSKSLKAPPKLPSSSDISQSSKSLSGIFSPPAMTPKTSTGSLSGLFSKPAALPSKAPSALSGLFAPPGNENDSAVNTTELRTGLFSPPSSKSLPPNLPNRSENPGISSSGQSNTLTGLFSAPPPPKISAAPEKPPPEKPPPNQLSGLFAPPQTSGPFVPSFNVQKNEPKAPFIAASKPKGNPLSNLFSPSKNPISQSPSTPLGSMAGLFTPPATPKPSPAQVDGLENPSEKDSLLTLTPTPQTSLSNPANVPKAAGLFVPPKNPDLEPPQSPSANPAAGLESLFRPPGNSPNASPQVANRPTVHRRTSSQSVPTVGRLDCINISGTSVKPKAILKSLQKATGRVCLTALECKGSNQSWTEDEVRSLIKVVSFAKMRLLDLEYHGPVVEEVACHLLSSSISTTSPHCSA